MGIVIIESFILLAKSLLESYWGRIKPLTDMLVSMTMRIHYSSRTSLILAAISSSLHLALSFPVNISNYFYGYECTKLETVPLQTLQSFQ